MAEHGSEKVHCSAVDESPKASAISVSPTSGIEAADNLLEPRVLSLVVKLHRRLEPARQHLLELRKIRQQEFDRGALPGYLSNQSPAASGDWQVATIPEDLLCRRVEITGPVHSAKMVIKMLSRGADGARADCAMVDFEDSLKPSWDNVLAGLSNVLGAARGDLVHEERSVAGEQGKRYQLDPDDMAVLMIRSRGLHLDEANVLIDGTSVAACLFDFTLCAFHAVPLLLARGKTPAFYIPKCETAEEAKWWQQLLSALEDELGLEKSTLRVTLLIETLTGAFEAEEILYELRDYALGLNSGRWDKIFSDIKTLRLHPDRIMADRGSIDMSRPWMKNYALRLIEVCHRHGAFAMGGMAAHTPGRDSAHRRTQVEKVRADKAFEAALGHDGCWVSHPYFIAPAMAEFSQRNQLSKFTELPDSRPDLLPQGGGPRTVAGLRKNIRVGIAYLHAWRRDEGCIAWDNLMEDLATLEISRAQVWQWLYHGVELDNGEVVTGDLIERLFGEELQEITKELGLDREQSKAWEAAAEEARTLFTAEEFREFLSNSSERKV